MLHPDWFSDVCVGSQSCGTPPARGDFNEALHVSQLRWQLSAGIRVLRGTPRRKTITLLTTHGEQPDTSKVPPDWKNAVLHARIDIGGTTLLGADIPPDRFQPMRSAYLSLMVDSVADAERIYALLSDGGQVFMPMEETFFASRFAMLRDRFGTSWMLLHERPSA